MIAVSHFIWVIMTLLVMLAGCSIIHDQPPTNRNRIILVTLKRAVS